MAGDLSYFWIPSPDPDRGRAFYSALFGWTLEPRSQGDGYGIASAAVYGGIVTGREGVRPMLYFDVPDVRDAVAEADEVGGQGSDVVEFEHGVSSEITYDDVEIGLFHPAGAAARRAADRPGDLGYFVVPIVDAGDARSFYAAVLGWEYDHDDIDAAYHHVANVTPPGGLYTEVGGSRPRSFFRVADFAAAAQRVRELGGMVGEPATSAFGTSADCSDDQEIEFSIWQPAEGM